MLWELFEINDFILWNCRGISLDRDQLTLEQIVGSNIWTKIN